MVDEAHTPPVTAQFGRDPVIIVWWASDVECVSAMSRRERNGRLDQLGRRGWRSSRPASFGRAAIRLLRVHPLHAADALQLAAAIVASENDPRSLRFVTLDERIAGAAAREGFPVVRPD